ncbi:hypothetical protein EVAR_27995_1 [Eumeta japonica]|uniref:Uncharacterized protein n=1 Tax=Eumeta variegata TaxID=151549 RepID=A0A4C1WDU6_EUMVA|nr:hypothetical protein EVAR_27995_1 [Eumeta japonica]
MTVPTMVSCPAREILFDKDLFSAIRIPSPHSPEAGSDKIRTVRVSCTLPVAIDNEHSSLLHLKPGAGADSAYPPDRLTQRFASRAPNTILRRQRSNRKRRKRKITDSGLAGHS